MKKQLSENKKKVNKNKNKNNNHMEKLSRFSCTLSQELLVTSSQHQKFLTKTKLIFGPGQSCL